MIPESLDRSTSTISPFASCLWTTRRPAPGPSLLHPRAPASTSARTPEWSSEIQQRTHLHTFITWPCTTWRLGGWCVLSAWRMCARTRRSWWRTSVNCRRASLRLLTASRQETDKRFLWSCRGSYKSSSKIRILSKTVIPKKLGCCSSSGFVYIWHNIDNKFIFAKYKSLATWTLWCLCTVFNWT